MGKSDKTHIDQYIITALAEGQHTVIDEVYKKYTDQVIKWITKNNGSAADAGDIFQEAIVVIYRQAREKGLQLSCPFSAYLMAIVKNMWYKELRKRGRRGVTKTVEEVYEIGTDSFKEAEETAHQLEKEKVVFRHYKKLGDRCREIIRLSMKKKWSQQELAEKLGLSYAYLRKKKSKCMSKLIEMIHASGFKM